MISPIQSENQNKKQVRHQVPSFKDVESQHQQTTSQESKKATMNAREIVIQTVKKNQSHSHLFRLGPVLASNPPVEHRQRVLRLVVRHHVTSLLDSHESQVAAALDLSNLLVANLEVSKRDLVEVLLARPLELLSPGVVSKPVADEVGVTSVDKNGDLGQEVDDELVERKHPVTVEQEVAVDVKVARLVGRNLSTEGLDDFGLVQVVRDPAELRVAQVVGVLARTTDVVNVDAGALVGTDHGVVTVDGGRDTGPNRLAVVAALDQVGTPGQRLVHGLALRLAEDGGVSTLTASHGAVVLVLGETVSQTVTNGNGLQVDVAVLVGENLRGELRNVVTAAC
jgi:hypothetical protein